MPSSLAPYLEGTEAAMRALLAAPCPELEPLYAMMRYHLGWADEHGHPMQAPGGKRVRPLLCLLSCQAIGGDWPLALPVAAGLELIHNFSLIHDDIEDGSNARRHRPTVWAVWGVPQAINAGDAMFTLARLAAHGLAGSVPAEVTLAVLRSMEEACLSLCQGQYLDMAFEKETQVTLTAYGLMIEGKTAALLACAAEAGALVGAGPGGPHATMGEFGRELGIAFQMVDDVLGIWGDPALTGKPAADDLRSRKKTLPVLRALEVLAARGDARLATLLTAPELGEEQIAAALACLDETGARSWTNDRAGEHTARALAALDRAAPPSPAREALRELALSLVGRDR